MKAILYTFLPLVFFTFFTIVLFVFLKEDVPDSQKEPQGKELFEDITVKKKEVKEEVKEDIVENKVIKKNREYVVKESKAGLFEVTNVRWHQHDDFERLVFDISTDSDQDNDVGICKIEPNSESTMYLKGELIGYRAFVPYLPTFASSQFIKDMKVVKNSDNNFVFTITFYNPISYKAFALKDPARIVIDIY